jgi:branched-chain amino acid transport system substrate-binding protein
MTRRTVLVAAAAVMAVTPVSGFAAADMLIGTAGAFTGSNAWIGEQYQQGSEMAVKDINAAGGLLGQQVKLIIADDACDGPQAVAAAEKLVADGVVFVAGHLCSAASIPASEVYHRAGILQISISTNPMLTELGRENVFRVSGRDDQQGAIAANYLAEHFAGAKIAIAHDGTTYGRGLAEETKKRLNALGLTEVVLEAVVPGQSDFSGLVDKLRAADASVLYYGGYAPEAALIVRTARESGLELQLVSGDAMATEQFSQVAGPAGEGTLFTFFPDARRRATAQQITEHFREEGFEPEGYTLFSYAAVQVWAQAVEMAGTVDTAKLIEVLRGNEFATVLGPLSFDGKGDVRQPAFDWYVWKDAGYTPVE